MPIEMLLDYVIAISALVTSVAAVVIAGIAHRFSKERARQDNESSVRQKHREWITDVDEMLARSEAQHGAVQPVIRRNLAPDQLKAIRIDTRRIDAQLAVLDGHLQLLPWLNAQANPWIDAFDVMEAGADGLLSAMLNGTLDVVNDRVLEHGSDTDDDSSHIKEGFWTELYFSEQQTASIPEIFTEGSRLDAHVEDATRRWVSPMASRNARIRIAALVRYKLHLELSLRSFFVGTFTDPAHGAGSAPSVKYRDGMRNTTSKLREDIDESMDALASAIR